MVIRVDGLVKRLGDHVVLDELSFVAPPGVVTGLLGPNGAGKTTTMRVLSTLLAPDEGTAEVAGIDVRADPHAVRASIGLLTEEPGLFDRLTPREQLRFSADVYGLSSAEAGASLAELAQRLQLEEHLDRRCAELSKGTRQKVALARAIIHRPPVLLLDEPTANLDLVAAAGLEELLHAPGLLDGTTVLLSSHRVDEVERLAEHVVGIVDGRTVASGSQDEIVEQVGASDFRSAVISLLGGAVLGGR